jgi:hypothetical protein
MCKAPVSLSHVWYRTEVYVREHARSVRSHESGRQPGTVYGCCCVRAEIYTQTREAKYGEILPRSGLRRVTTREAAG